MDLLCYERDQGLVLARFWERELDYLDAASEVVETEFFRYLGAQEILRALAPTYPTPRQKEEVPLWIYLASNLSLRLLGVPSFHAYPYVGRCGGMLNAFGPTVATKVTHPDTGEVTLRCAGFNAEHHYDRQSPCDHPRPEEHGGLPGCPRVASPPRGRLHPVCPARAAAARHPPHSCGVPVRMRRLEVTRQQTRQARRDESHLRTHIEEGHRQLKCFWDLTHFPSRAFTLVVNQVVFVALAY